MTIEQIRKKIEDVLTHLADLGLGYKREGLHFTVLDPQGFNFGFGFEDERQMLAWLEGVVVGILYYPKREKNENSITSQ